MIKRLFTQILLVLALTIGAGSSLLAQTILTVTVKSQTQGEVVTEFSREDLLALGDEVLTTRNEYVDREHQFTGPLMRNLVQQVGANSATVARLTAVNDYTVEIDPMEFQKYDVILAMSQDGVALSLRDKGPIWLIYPMSQFEELQDPVFNNRLIWQLDRLEFE